MKVESIRLRGIKCFEDTGHVELAPRISIFVGHNNSGKSTLLSSILGWQLPSIRGQFLQRYSASLSSIESIFTDVQREDLNGISASGRIQFSVSLLGANPDPVPGITAHVTGLGNQVFNGTFPKNPIVPFTARRKAPIFNENVNLATQQQVTGTFENLYCRIDQVATYGTTAHEMYRSNIESILGLFVATMSSGGGKRAGYYFDGNANNFVALDQMGDGVAEIAALVAEISLSKGKIFLLEEPETNLHPKGLKALLKLIRESSYTNQFIITTHSNIVIRELGGIDDTKIFQVSNTNESPHSPSVVNEIGNNRYDRVHILRDLGYEFSDLDLHDAWLFLEESSAETIVRDVLVPMFAPELAGRLRTFSTAGVDGLKNSLSEFKRLVTFIHLEPVYRDRLWVRADGDERGTAVIKSIKETFAYLDAERAATFSERQFELYFPSKYRDRATAVLSIQDKKSKSTEKHLLLQDVLEWTRSNFSEAKKDWETSASEIISLLRSISQALVTGRR